MRSRWYLAAPAAVLGCCALIYFAGTDSAGSVESAQALAGETDGGVVLESPEDSDDESGRQRVPLQGGELEPCAFFEPWAARGPSHDGVQELLNEIRPIAERHVDCVPVAWWMEALVMECEGALRLSSAEHDLLAGAISARMGELRNGPREAFANRIAIEDPDSPGFHESIELLRCLVHGMLGPDAPPDTLAKLWAWWLVTAYGGLDDGSRGSMFEADARVVAALRLAMSDWPLHDDAWWRSLWDGLPDEPPADQASVAVRIAMFEALSGILPEGAWIDRLARIAEFESFDEPVGFQSLWGLGASLGRHLSEERLAGLLAIPGGDEWQRALLMNFPDGLEWPASAAGAPESVRRALLELRDSDTFAFRRDVIQHQWRLLGPAEAVIDLERFVLDSHPWAEEWDWDAALRIHAALEAIRLVEQKGLDQDAAAIEHARALLRQFVLSSPPADVERALHTLRDRLWRGGQPDLRLLLGQVLGPLGLEALSTELREWLSSGS